MPLDQDWTVDTSQVTSTVSVQHHTSSPLTGNRSVRFNITTGGVAGTRGAGAVYLIQPTHNRGHVMGRLQSQMRVDSDVSHAGIYFLGSQASGISGTGSCYLFGPSGASNTLRLKKVASGIFDDAPTLLETTGIDVGGSPTDIFALEVEWKANIDIFGGTHIICRYGATIGSMEDVLEYVDESSPLIVGASEGLFAFRSGITTVGQAVFDQTSLYSITV